MQLHQKGFKVVRRACTGLIFTNCCRGRTSHINYLYALDHHVTRQVAMNLLSLSVKTDPAFI
jgi:hypothetical protein